MRSISMLISSFFPYIPLVCNLISYNISLCCLRNFKNESISDFLIEEGFGVDIPQLLEVLESDKF